MSLYEYIASNNSSGANELLKNYGFSSSRSIDEIIHRLKVIVRKYKKLALQDISEIHPDKELLSLFTTSNLADRDFAYATGRTPGFEEPIEVPDTSFVSNLKTLTEQQSNQVVKEIREVKEQILRDKINISKKELDSKIRNTQFGNSPVILLAVGFAVGYMIAKK
jgi:hypothetical protein|tara:strand:- start:1475 stop:1969 length:495 start_codon:yes stop_codon:yes gene_type:complete